MARSGDDWDELTERTRQRKQTRRKRNRRQRSAEEQADHDYNEEHSAKFVSELAKKDSQYNCCLLYTSPSPRDVEESRMPSSA